MTWSKEQQEIRRQLLEEINSTDFSISRLAKLLKKDENTFKAILLKYQNEEGYDEPSVLEEAAKKNSKAVGLLLDFLEQSASIYGPFKNASDMEMRFSVSTGNLYSDAIPRGSDLLNQTFTINMDKTSAKKIEEQRKISSNLKMVFESKDHILDLAIIVNFKFQYLDIQYFKEKYIDNIQDNHKNSHEKRLAAYCILDKFIKSGKGSAADRNKARELCNELIAQHKNKCKGEYLDKNSNMGKLFRSSSRTIITQYMEIDSDRKPKTEIINSVSNFIKTNVSLDVQVALLETVHEYNKRHLDPNSIRAHDPFSRAEHIIKIATHDLWDNILNLFARIIGGHVNNSKLEAVATEVRTAMGVELPQQDKSATGAKRFVEALRLEEPVKPKQVSEKPKSTQPQKKIEQDVEEEQEHMQASRMMAAWLADADEVEKQHMEGVQKQQTKAKGKTR